MKAKQTFRAINNGTGLSFSHGFVEFSIFSIDHSAKTILFIAASCI